MPGSPQPHDTSVLIHGRFRSEKWDFQDHILPPITTAVTFRLRSAERGGAGFQQFANPDVDRLTAPPIYIYSRLDEPCSGMLEENLAYAEKGDCAVSFATGMAAMSAAIGIHIASGDHVLFHPAIYGCTYSHLTSWLSRYGVTAEAVDCRDAELVSSKIRPETKVIVFETPCNPTLELIDISALAEVLREVNLDREADRRVVMVIDNTFASPWGQRPLELGADIVVQSLTKHIGGFGATMGGAVIARRDRESDLLMYRKDFGGSLSPDSAWHILTYGLPTLAMRMERQQVSAKIIAEQLAQHPLVAKVAYPGLKGFPARDLAHRQMRTVDGDFAPGTMIYFELAGDGSEALQRAVKVVNWLAKNSLSITLAVSLGQIRTLIEHPATMTHSAIAAQDQEKGGISAGGLRLSLGLEDVRDIGADLLRSLELCR